MSIAGGDNPQGDHAVRRLDDFVDETLKASFRASDPPGWTLGGSRRDSYEPENLETMMHRAQAQPKIYVTTHDYERLWALADFYQSRRRGVLVDFLMDELERAELVAAVEVGAKVVTMNSAPPVSPTRSGAIVSAWRDWSGCAIRRFGPVASATPPPNIR